MAQDIGLHNLKPKDGSRHRKKRVGRGEGSGLGKTSGRGEKGYGARSGAKKRPNFEGGQMPIHMRLRKLRGPHMKKSMPFEQFGRTQTQPVNLKDLEARFDAGAEVTPESLREKGLATRKDVPVKILGQGDLEQEADRRASTTPRRPRARRSRARAARSSCSSSRRSRRPRSRSPRLRREPKAAEPKSRRAEESGRRMSRRPTSRRPTSEEE